jgi:hypothetical protein
MTPQPRRNRETLTLTLDVAGKFFCLVRGAGPGRSGQFLDHLKVRVKEFTISSAGSMLLRAFTLSPFNRWAW